MKNLFFTLTAACFASAAFSQDPANSYTNGSNTMPGSQNQPAELYPGTNPAPNTNQRGGATITIPDPTGQRTGSNSTYYQPPTGATPAETNPGNPYPNTRPNTTTPTPTQQVHRLFQDPVRTSKYPNSDPPTGSRDGSSGKYKANHKSSNGHNFAKHKKHIKKAKKTENHSDKTRQEVR